MSKLLHGLSRAAPGLLALRPTLSAESLRPGMLLRLGGGGHPLHAALLCWRGGIALAAPISGWPGSPRVHTGPVPDDASDGVALIDAVAAISPAASDAASAAGAPAVVDCFGAPLASPPAGSAPAGGGSSHAPLPLMAASPWQADLQPIHASLHTGTAAVDVLTPIGRGQTMLIIGPDGTGKSSVALDAIVAQATSAVHCILALSSPGAQDAAELAAWLCSRAEAFAARNGTTGGAASPEPLSGRLTIVVPRSETAAERTLVAAAACALGERVRDRGGHALVVVDSWQGPCEVWEEASALAAGVGGLGVPAGAGLAGPPDGASVAELVAGAQRLDRLAAEQRQHGAEQRVFYGAMLQRAAQLNDKTGGGSLTLIATVDELSAPADAAGAVGAGRVGGPAGAVAAAFALSDFASRPRSQRMRLEALVARGLPLTQSTLERIGIPPPPHALGRDGTAAPGVEAAAQAVALARRSNWSHLDQLKSLADGHVQLRPDLFALGRRPALRPHESIARVGVGSDAAVRPQPWSAGMMSLARSLRLELAQAADLDSASDALSVLQRTRAAALSAALCTQRAGEPRPLADELTLLLALLHGHLDHLAQAPAQVAALEVDALLTHVRAAAPAAVAAVERSGRLESCVREELLASVRAKMPGRAQRGLFVSWDTDPASGEARTGGTPP